MVKWIIDDSRSSSPFSKHFNISKFQHVKILRSQINFQIKVMFNNGATEGLAKWIIDDSRSSSSIFPFFPLALVGFRAGLAIFCRSRK